MVKLIGFLLVLLVASPALAKPHKTTMLGTDRALECDFTSNGWCERADLPDIQISTTRASTRMCLKGDGTWQTVPENTPCIGAQGLASFGAGTNYWANSTDPTAWSVSGCGTVSASGGGWYTLDDPNGSGKCGRRVVLTDVAATTGSYTLTCGMRAGSLTEATLLITSTGGTVASGECVITSLGAAEGRYSCTATVSGTPTNVQGHVLVGALSIATGTVQVNQCQLEKSPTPGPRHDCGGSACSWAADVHTVSTAGWPVASGEVRLQYTPLVSTAATNFLLDSGATGVRIFRTGGNALRADIGGGTISSAVLDWVPDAFYDVRLVVSGTTATLYRNGSQVATGTVAAPTHAAVAYIGANTSGLSQANGSVRLLRVSE